MISRRVLLIGAGAGIVAPAVISIGSLMKLPPRDLRAMVYVPKGRPYARVHYVVDSDWVSEDVPIASLQVRENSEELVARVNVFATFRAPQTDCTVHQVDVIVPELSPYKPLFSYYQARSLHAGELLAFSGGIILN